MMETMTDRELIATYRGTMNHVTRGRAHREMSDRGLIVWNEETCEDALLINGQLEDMFTGAPIAR